MGLSFKKRAYIELRRELAAQMLYKRFISSAYVMGTRSVSLIAEITNIVGIHHNFMFIE